MHTQPQLASCGSPVPGVIPEPVRVVGDTPDRSAGRTRPATDRWVDAGGSHDPDRPDLSEVTLGRG
jgi:hypothetical protein